MNPPNDKLAQDTPRTEAQHKRWTFADDPYGEMVKFARQLERELAQATWELNDRRGMDKAREEDRLRAVEELRARSSASSDSAAVQELRNITDAKRFNREMFRDDTEFADWAQNRCRHALAKYVVQGVPGKDHGA